MNDPLRTLVGFLAGTISGGIVGGVMLGVPTYLDDSCGFLGCTRGWTAVAVYMGFIAGAVPGAVIGTIVSTSPFSRLKSTGIGALTGLIVAIFLFSTGGWDDELVSTVAVLSIPGGALVGLVVRVCLRFPDVSSKARNE